MLALVGSATLPETFGGILCRTPFHDAGYTDEKLPSDVADSECSTAAQEHLPGALTRGFALPGIASQVLDTGPDRWR